MCETARGTWGIKKRKSLETNYPIKKKAKGTTETSLYECLQVKITKLAVKGSRFQALRVI